MKKLLIFTFLSLGLISSCKKEKRELVTTDPNIAAVAADKAALAASSIQGANPDLANVTMALTNPLPASGSHGSTITWTSNIPSVVSSDGQTVARPAFGQPNANVAITATISKGIVVDTKTFSLLVLASTDNPDVAFVAADKAALKVSAILGANPDSAHISVSLTNPLPSSGSHGSVITWTSSNTAVVSNDGQTVVRPAYGQPNASVVMTAKLSKGVIADTKTFSLIVPASTVNPDVAFVAADKAALKVSAILGANQDSAHITIPLTNPLPASGANGSTITWASNNAAIVSNDGQTVIRPVYGQPNATVTMTAKLSKGVVADTKTFTLTVLARTDSFVITNIDYLPNTTCWHGYYSGYYDFINGFNVTGTYLNSSPKQILILSGTILYGDGATDTLFALGELEPNGNTSDNGIFYVMVEPNSRPPHEYAGPGTYLVTIQLTANFPDGAIVSSFSKSMVFDCKYF